ncbi:MAG: 2-C-methyl-D-erythritol 4-phosphate cytidylyltransferase [Mariprofundales bacterium]|nr:2-C-methyl-D-erythritol 4-phosphate cytidylyltransferase [Mariprofundales bacterium]
MVAQALDIEDILQVGVLLLAAGSGRRLGSAIPKQYLEVAGKPLLLHTLRSLEAEERIRWLQPVIGADDAAYFAAAVAGQVFTFALLPPVVGGSERALSMVAGLRALPDAVEMVAVHDAARPLPSAALLANLLDAAQTHGAAVPGVAVTDTIKEVDDGGMVVRTLARCRLRAVQTPQVARREWLQQAIVGAGGQLSAFTDDLSLLEAAGFPVHVSLGEAMNRKITTIEDFHWLEGILQSGQ